MNVSRKSLFWADEGFSTVGMVLALLITLSLIFTCAQVYEINTTSAQIQETADAAVLAAENTVGEFYIVVTICDALTFTLSLAMLTTLGLGIVCACIPATAALSKGLLDASAQLRKARDSFYDSAQKSLDTLQQALPFIAVLKAQEVLTANSSEEGARYIGLVVLCPWIGTSDETLTFEQGDQAYDQADQVHEQLGEQAAQAEEAAQKANEWKEHAYKHDSGSQTEYCMFERATKLAGMEGLDNPYFSSIDTWNFDAALQRAKRYYQLRYEHEQPLGASVDEQANSALRKQFYAYAVDTISQGYVNETDVAFDAWFPLLPKNTDEMRATSLYRDAVYPKTQGSQGTLMLHAYDQCPGRSLGSDIGYGSISDMDGSGAYETCPYCQFIPSSMGKVAAASSHIENGFEYHYNEVARAASEYQKAREEFDPLSKQVKDTANGLFDVLISGLIEGCSKRMVVLPPGHWGAVALVADTSSPESRFSSLFVSGKGSGSLGTRVALSSATLVRETSDEGTNVLTTFLDGVDSGNGGVGAARIVLGVWSGLLNVYAQGQEALSSTIEQVLRDIPLASSSGLGRWAADTFEEKIAEVGFAPPDLRARKAVLVNSYHVLQADDSAFSARLLSAKQAAAHFGEGGVQGALSALELSAAGIVEDISSDFVLATVVLVEGVIEIPITLSLPAPVSESIAQMLQQGIDRLYEVVASWTGVRPWR